MLSKIIHCLLIVLFTFVVREVEPQLLPYPPQEDWPLPVLQAPEVLHVLQLRRHLF